MVRLQGHNSAIGDSVKRRVKLLKIWKGDEQVRGPAGQFLSVRAAKWRASPSYGSRSRALMVWPALDRGPEPKST
jgi:hypothetical protein